MNSVSGLITAFETYVETSQIFLQDAWIITK